MTATTTRRALLGGAGLTGAALLVPAATTTAARPTAVSPELAALIEVSAAAARASDDHYRLVYNPARDQVTAAIDALPHTTVHAGPSMGGGEVVWSTAKPSTVAVARTIVAMEKEGRDVTGAGVKHARTIVAAQIRRDRAIARIRRYTGYDAANFRCDDMSNAMADADCAVAAHPVSTGIDLATKLAFMIEHQMGDGMNWLDELHADAARIAKVEG